MKIRLVPVLLRGREDYKVQYQTRFLFFTLWKDMKYSDTKELYYLNCVLNSFLKNVDAKKQLVDKIKHLTSKCIVI
jgi:hypothetical protein